ncbi:MAG: hypothetical protein KDC25_04475 [Saprospiraceae bacterium]|nr:hypothetical protein [Saprospiraceae bacterium]
MVYSCYTIDPDFDEVTFDDDCAIAGIASRYLDAIQYFGNNAVAVRWLSGHVSDLVALMDHVEDHVQETGIKSYHGAMLDLLDNNEGYVRQRFFELWDAIVADPHVLLRPCVEQNTSYPYTFWSDLYNFQPDQSTISALASRGFTYQPLQEGNAVATSVDYYYVEIDQMPDFNGDGSPDSEQQVIDVLRANFAGLASGVKNGFQFSCPLPPWHNNPDNIWWEFKPYTTGIDNVQWSYPAPTYKNTIFFIDAGAEDQNNNEFADKGAIIISQASPCCWIGSTINTPLSGSQPFSGQRQWGLATLPNGKKAFYTKAADRALTESWLPTIAGEIWQGCDDDTYYNIAHETWKNLMLKAGAFINQFGGQVVSEPGYSEPAINITKARINYNELDGKLKSNTPVNFISCE